MCYNLCNKLWFGCCWAGNGHGIRFHKVEPMLGERDAHRQPTVQFGTVKNSPGLHDWTKKMSMCYLYEIACNEWLELCGKELLMHENLLC